MKKPRLTHDLSPITHCSALIAHYLSFVLSTTYCLPFIFLFTFALPILFPSPLIRGAGGVLEGFFSNTALAAGSWDELAGSATGGGVSNNAGISAAPSLALNASGNPHIAWHDYSGGDAEIYYRYWNPLGGCQCPDDRIPPTGCISGRVTNLAGQPLAGKKVILVRSRPTRAKWNTLTDSNGCYNFTDLVDGTYKVKLNRRECGRVREKIIIEGGAKVNDVNLTCLR